MVPYDDVDGYDKEESSWGQNGPNGVSLERRKNNTGSHSAAGNGPKRARPSALWTGESALRKGHSALRKGQSALRKGHSALRARQSAPQRGHSVRQEGHLDCRRHPERGTAPFPPFDARAAAFWDPDESAPTTQTRLGRSGNKKSRPDSGHSRLFPANCPSASLRPALI